MVTSRQPVVRRLAALMMLLAMVGGGCSADDAVPPGGVRTFYEALDLGTPSAAAETFFDAFARDDFMTVWLILHPTTHFRLREDLQGLQHGVVVDREAMPRDALEEIVTSQSLWSDPVFLFDALMLTADRHDAFIVDLSGPVRVSGETVDGDQAVLTLDGEGIDDTLVLRMRRLSTGRWAVRDVVAGDRDEPVWPRPSP